MLEKAGESKRKGFPPYFPFPTFFPLSSLPSLPPPLFLTLHYSKCGPWSSSFANKDLLKMQNRGLYQTYCIINILRRSGKSEMQCIKGCVCTSLDSLAFG